MTDNPLLVVGVIVVLGVAMNFLRLWTLMAGGTRAARLSRINDLDSHMSFDERIAEKMRELAKENQGSADPSATPASPASPAAPAAKGFGRRVV